MNGTTETRDVVIFGTEEFSSLIWYCLLHDTRFRPVAFTVDAAYLRKPVHEGLPVVAFEELPQRHPPGSVRLIISLDFHAINGLRRARYEQAVAWGYDFISYVSSRACVWPDMQIGKNCLIYELAIIQPFSRVGGNVIIRSSAHISHHCKVGNHAFIAAGVNANMSEMHAAMGLCVLPRVNEIIASRRAVSEYYDYGLKGIGLIRPQACKCLEYNYAYYPVVFPSHDDMMRVRQALRDNGVGPRRYFYPSLNRLPYLRPELQRPCPVSESVAPRVLCLPLYFGLKQDELEMICKVIAGEMK